MMDATDKSKDEGRQESKAERTVESATTGPEQFQPDETKTDQADWEKAKNALPGGDTELKSKGNRHERIEDE